MADFSTLDDVFQNTAIGSVDKAIGNNLYGINHRQIPAMVSSNKDTYGLTFFVRPQLNLQTENIRNVRYFYPLLTSNPVSMQRFVRCTLDPRLQYDGIESNPRIYTPLVDPQQAFIPILTNNLTALSGWPDLTVPTFTSEQGAYNEAYTQADGVTRNFEVFSIDATFRNTRGDPIVYLFYIWEHYQSLVFEGILMPYIDYLLENEIDYMTRIYRLTLDPTKTYVRKIGATGVCFPISNPIGSFMDFNDERVYNDQNKDITIRFQVMGVDYFDDILVYEFNETVKIFNPSMRAVEDVKRVEGDITVAGDVVKVPRQLLTFFNHRGYPWINPDNYELEWWIPNLVYNTRINNIIVPSDTTELYQGD